jgi:Uncharacterized protein conserved in bacteria (DUF2252)
VVANGTTIEERRTRGRAARETVSRKSHREWREPAGRTEPVALLEEQGKARIAELLPIRYARMAASPFAFFRGSAAIMAADLTGMPRSGLTAQLCGDAHVANFGGFAAPDRELVFDLNDFDETLPGPWEWDVKRLGASIAIAARDAGLGGRDRRTAVAGAGRAYREAMRDFSDMRNLDVWYSRLDSDEILARARAGLGEKAARKLERDMERAERKAALREQVARGPLEAAAIFAADKLSRARVLGSQLAAGLPEDEAAPKVDHYRASLAMLQWRLGRRHRLVEQLRTELDRL